jgi:hypothetical protein
MIIKVPCDHGWYFNYHKAKVVAMITMYFNYHKAKVVAMITRYF